MCPGEAAGVSLCLGEAAGVSLCLGEAVSVWYIVDVAGRSTISEVQCVLGCPCDVDVWLRGHVVDCIVLGCPCDA